MEFSEIKIGTKLDITLFNNEGIAMHPALVSQFETVEAEDLLAILAPLREGIFFPIHPGDVMELVFSQSTRFFGFRAVADDRYREGRIRFLYIRPVSEIGTVQRRGFFRYSGLLPCKYRLINEVNPQKNETVAFQSTITKDISGGGVGLLFEDRPEMGMNIEGKLLIGEEIQFTGTIVRVSTLGEDTAYQYEGGISFTSIDNWDREKIIKFIYDAQRNLLKKGWTDQ